MSKNDLSRLVLGTAQLGMSYGIANDAGQPDQKMADAIVEAAWQNSGCEFDTAQAYGESEIVLGKSLKNLGLTAKAKVISKPSPELSFTEPGSLLSAMNQTLENLNMESIYGYMFHKADYLEIWDKGLKEQTEELRARGLAQKIGVSVYSPEDAVRAVETNGIELIQLPSNIFDRRFENSGVFEKAIDSGKTIYVRSVFLQGLMFMDETTLPKYMSFAAPYLEKLDGLVRESGLSIQELALGYAAKAYPQAKILTGAELPEQMNENIAHFNCEFTEELVGKIKRTFSTVPEKILNPVLWGT
ncbi:aldo/keto reductase [Maridesulfovibrio sp.]|uniref:aldo/keto reductase n=1 Tax=Maridesulfovibrio sp. TaxID=2795000 RepID=UPI0029C9F475|nr:aldo/keto reductase [Maridesulfovibrio sp.]